MVIDLNITSLSSTYDIIYNNFTYLLMAGTTNTETKFHKNGVTEPWIHCSNLLLERVQKDTKAIPIQMSASMTDLIMVKDGAIILKEPFREYPSAIIVNSDSPKDRQVIVLARSVDSGQQDFCCIVVGKDGKIRKGTPATMGKYATSEMAEVASTEDRAGIYPLNNSLGALIVPEDIKFDFLKTHKEELERMIATGNSVQAAFKDMMELYYEQYPFAVYSVQEISYLGYVKGIFSNARRQRMGRIVR